MTPRNDVTRPEEPEADRLQTARTGKSSVTPAPRSTSSWVSADRYVDSMQSHVGVDLRTARLMSITSDRDRGRHHKRLPTEEQR